MIASQRFDEDVLIMAFPMAEYWFGEAGASSPSIQTVISMISPSLA